MVTQKRPLEKLLWRAAENASGEFVCASPAGEIHVYLQEGRIAWATDSRHPFAFATHLQESTGIDSATFRQVIEECRREKLPLGETLVQWGLTDLEGVRAALASQIREALLLLSTVDTAQDLFLERKYHRYAESLTFNARELIGEHESVLDRHSGVHRTSVSGDTRPDLARQLRASVEGLAWVEVCEHDAVVDADPKANARRTPRELVQRTLLDGCDFAAIRSTRSSVVGFRLGGLRSVWSRLSADSTFGSVVSAIWTVAGASERTLPSAMPRSDQVWWVGAEGTPLTQAIRAFMRRADELLGAVVLGGESGDEPLAGCGYRMLELEQSLDTARRRRCVLTLEVLPVGDETERTLDSIGFTLRTMVSGEARLWCFGAQLELSGGQTLWLFLDRRSSQGLGWAYLTALSRVLCSDSLRREA